MPAASQSPEGDPVRPRTAATPAFSARHLRAAVVVIAANAVGVIVFLCGRADRLLRAVVDPVHPDWAAMERAFAGYAMYAVSLAAAAAAALLAVAWMLVQRFRSPVTPARPRLGVTIPAVALALFLTTAVVLVFIDVLLFQDYGVHLYEFDVFGILATAALRRDLGIQPAEVFRVALAATMLLATEMLLLLAAIRVAQWRNGALPRVSGTVLLILIPCGFIVFRGAERTISTDRTEFERALPLGQQLLLRAANRPYIPVEPRIGRGGYPVLSANDDAALARRPNILFFVPDGLRGDMVRPELTPNLLRFAARPDVVHSARHFSTGHISESGIFGLLYGVNGQAFNAFVAARVPAFPLEVLKRNGYHTFFLASSRLNPWPTDQLMRVFDEVAYPANDDDALAKLADYIEARRRDGRPYFVLAFFYTPHYPFTSAKPHLRKYPVVGPSARTNYMNDVLQADEYFGQAFDLVSSEYDAGRTVVLATSDHGEEIRDHGVFGHAPATFWNEKIVVPFMLGLPGATLEPGTRNPTMTSHVDVWPTLFDYMGGRMVASNYSDGRSLLTTGRGAPPVVIGRFFPYADRPSVLIDSTTKYWFRATGLSAGHRLCLDIIRATDLDDRPIDTRNLLPSSVPAFAKFQSAFWKFIRYTGPETHDCARL